MGFCSLFVVSLVVELLNIGGELIGEHGLYAPLASVGNGPFVVPTLEFNHGKRLLKAGDLPFDVLR